MKCAYEECNNEFEPKTHNQKYCSDECCRTATNLKLKEKYYEKKARRAGVVFKCKGKGCNQELSMYTDDYICNVCKSKKRSEERKLLIEMVLNVSGKTNKA
jgi:hypothetical protein